MRLPYEYFPLDSRALGERKREEELKALAPSMSFFFYNLLVYALHRLLKNASLLPVRFYKYFERHSGRSRQIKADAEFVF